MDTNLLDNSKKIPLEELSKEELIKKCKTLLTIAHKAKNTKDTLQQENNELKDQLNLLNNDTTKEIIDNLTQQKLNYVTTIEELKSQNNSLNTKLERSLNSLHELEQTNNRLDNENVSFKRQVKRLTDENEQLLSQLETLEKQLEEQQKQLLKLEESKTKEDKLNELQNMLSISLSEIKKLQNEKTTITQKLEILQQTLSEKDKSIIVISQELNTKTKETEKLKTYRSKIIKLAGNVKLIKDDRNNVLGLFKNYIEQVKSWKSQLDSVSKQIFDYVSRIETENGLLKENNSRMIEQLEAHKTDDEKMFDNKKLTDEINKLLTNEESYKKTITSQQNEIETVRYERDEFLKLGTVESVTKQLEDNKTQIEKLKEELDKSQNEIQTINNNNSELREENEKLLKQLEDFELIEQRIANETSEEIMKLVQENKKLMKLIENEKTCFSIETQTELIEDENEKNVIAMKRENSELLIEMNEMNQALKERGGNISKLQAHCDEIMKKLQIYETQANKNVDNLTQKEEIIKTLQDEILQLKTTKTVTDDDNEELIRLRNEIELLKEKNNNLIENNYADNDQLSSSTISKTDELNRLKDLEGSWEERYSKLRNLALKLKSKIRELTNQLTQIENEKIDLETKNKTLQTIQLNYDKLLNELDDERNLTKKLLKDLDLINFDLINNKEINNQLKNEINELNNEKLNTEQWKKQVSYKIQMLRKEVDTNNLLRNDYDNKIKNLQEELLNKDCELKNELELHNKTKHLLEIQNTEIKKNSVINLEIQDYERNINELSLKLNKKQEEILLIKQQFDLQKNQINLIKDENKLLEQTKLTNEMEFNLIKNELEIIKKQCNTFESNLLDKDNKIQNLLLINEQTHLENENLSIELTKILKENEKIHMNLKNEKELLRKQNVLLQQNLCELQEQHKFKLDELKIIENDYNNYKVRAQSVLRQNQNRNVGLEDKLNEEVVTLKTRIEQMQLDANEYNTSIEQLKITNEKLLNEKKDLTEKLQELQTEIEELKENYKLLLVKNQQTNQEHSETVRGLKIHAETLSQCYRQQLSEQEVRHNREIIQLQSKLVEKLPTTTTNNQTEILTNNSMPPREEGEGSESIESQQTLTKTVKNHVQPIPLERLLSATNDQEFELLKKQLNEQDCKLLHLTALLADTEQDLVKHVQMNKVLKEEIRRQQRSVEREKHAENLEYLKNVVLKFVTLQNGDERSRLVPVLNTILKLSPEETQKLNLVVKGGDLKGWTNYLPLWQSPSTSK